MEMEKKGTGISPLTKKRKITKREWQLYSLCAIPILWVFIFCYLPMGGIVIAFKDYKFSKGIFGSDWVGLNNFKFFVQSNEFLRLVRNTIGLNFVFIIVNLVAALTVAILLFGLKSRTKTKVFQTMMITPHFMSWVVVSYMLYGFLHPSNGIVNTLLVSLGLEKIDWYSRPNAWPFILTIASVWKRVGMDSVIYYAALMGIDPTFYEAAEIDGAKKWQINLYIVLPQLVPLIVMLQIMAIGGIFRADFGMFYQLPRDIGLLYSTTDVIDTYIFRAMRVIGDMGMSSAVGLLQSVVGLILVITTNALSKKVDSELGIF